MDQYMQKAINTMQAATHCSIIPVWKLVRYRLCCPTKDGMDDLIVTPDDYDMNMATGTFRDWRGERYRITITRETHG